MKIFIVLFFLLSPLLSHDFVVIANQKMPTLSPLQIKAIFLKKLTIVNDINIVPLNLNAQNKTRLIFEQNILHMSFERLKNYWSKQHYLGHRPPISMHSQQSVKKFVKKVDGAIGYIDANLVDDDIKIIYKWSE